MTPQTRFGPILLALGATHEAVALQAVVVTSGEPPEALHADGTEGPVEPEALWHRTGAAVWRYRFDLPARDGVGYRIGDSEYAVAADLAGDLRIGFVSCNGQEIGDSERPDRERNAMWARLAETHADRPLHLLLHGGDQIYADEVVGAHPQLKAWQSASRRRCEGMPFTEEMAEAVDRFFMQRYERAYSYTDTAHLLATAPSMMMWDDHDIMDGWGSHPDWFQNSPVALGLYEVAHRYFSLLQLGIAPGERSPIGTTEAQHCHGWQASFPGLTVCAPDLRAERLPDRVMGPDGWAGFESALGRLEEPQRILMISTVPALGPRLSLLERVAPMVPKLREFTDDLRDQWQSRSHREEWKRFLRVLVDLVGNRGHAVTVVSGEIHLATQGIMETQSGTIRQLVASGIAHPAPPDLYAWSLSQLARLGEQPLPDHPIRLLPLPGRSQVYLAERNFLLLEREGARWTARWATEAEGWTEALEI